jgi:hypothetical protein
MKISHPIASALLVLAPLVIAASAETTYVNLHFRTVSGVRPFVDVQLNGTAFLFMLHANAGLYAMTNHANAIQADVTVPASDREYGIEATGKKSTLGHASAKLTKLGVGSHVWNDVPLDVFETPQDPPMEGMLGVGWIRSSKCIVDYDRLLLGVPDSDADGIREDQILRRRGYVAHHMTWEPTHKRYYVEGTLNGVAVRLNIGTVSNNIIDLAFAQRAHVRLGPAVDEAGGPKGTVVPQYLAKDFVAIRIGNQTTAPSQPLIWNTAEYDSHEHATSEVTLGAEFMLANRAIINFGTDTLFLPPTWR